MARFRNIALRLPKLLEDAWWEMFLTGWDLVADAVGEKHGLMGPTYASEFAPAGDPINADWDR